MGAAPSRSLVIEDSVNGVLAGKAAGMTVWGFVGGSHYQERDGAALLSAAGADRIVRDMSDLRGSIRLSMASTTRCCYLRAFWRSIATSVRHIPGWGPCHGIHYAG